MHRFGLPVGSSYGSGSGGGVFTISAVSRIITHTNALETWRTWYGVSSLPASILVRYLGNEVRKGKMPGNDVKKHSAQLLGSSYMFQVSHFMWQHRYLVCNWPKCLATFCLGLKWWGLLSRNQGCFFIMIIGLCTVNNLNGDKNPTNVLTTTMSQYHWTHLRIQITWNN